MWRYPKRAIPPIQVVELAKGENLQVDISLEENLVSFTIKPDPADANVRVLNIPDTYQPGMKLEPGRYKIEVSKKGYETTTGWVEVKQGQDFYSTVALKPVSGAIYGKTYTDPTTGMEFVYVKGGCYPMGDTFGDGDKDEKPVHEVCVDDLYVGKYEVTQDESDRSFIRLRPCVSRWQLVLHPGVLAGG